MSLARRTTSSSVSNDMTAEAAVGGPAAGEHPGAFAASEVDVPGDLVALVLEGQRAEFCLLVQGVPDADGPGALGDPLQQLVVDRPVREHPAARDAGLPGRGEDAGDDAPRGVRDVRVLDLETAREATVIQTPTTIGSASVRP